MELDVDTYGDGAGSPGEGKGEENTPTYAIEANNYDADDLDNDLNENEHKILTSGNEIQNLNIIQQNQSDGKPEFTNNVSKVASRGGSNRDSLDFDHQRNRMDGSVFSKYKDSTKMGALKKQYESKNLIPEADELNEQTNRGAYGKYAQKKKEFETLKERTIEKIPGL